MMTKRKKITLFCLTVLCFAFLLPVTVSSFSFKSFADEKDTFIQEEETEPENLSDFLETISADSIFEAIGEAQSSDTRIEVSIEKPKKSKVTVRFKDAFMELFIWAKETVLSIKVPLAIILFLYIIKGVIAVRNRREVADE